MEAANPSVTWLRAAQLCVDLQLPSHSSAGRAWTATRWCRDNVAVRRGNHARLAVAVCGALLVVCGCRPAPQDSLERAWRLDLDGKHEEAIAVYRSVLEGLPDSFDAHYGIARALDLAGRYDDARQHFATAIELAPEDAKDQALRMMGVSHAFVHDADGAAPYFKLVIQRRVDAGNFAGAAEAANELGRVYLEVGNPGEAFRWYRTGYELALREPDQPASLTDLAELRWAHAQARIAARRGDASEACKQAAVVKTLLDKGSNPDQRIQYPYLRGYIDFHLGNHEQAVERLQQADHEDPFILLLLAESFETLGNAEKSREYYRRVLASSSHAVNNAFARPVARDKIAQTR